MSPTRHASWQQLRALADTWRKKHLRQVFEHDPGRAASMTAAASGIHLDYSKNSLDSEVLALLIELARDCDLAGQREAMFSGQRYNLTEGRAVLHTALRQQVDTPVKLDGEDVIPGVREVRARCYDFAERVRSGAWRGHTGQTITDVVNIGIGGSDLGPLMVCEALSPLADGPRVHFVSNVDGTHLSQTLRRLDASRTLFVVASKTFTTIETLSNARSARAWLVEALGSETAVARHFVAVSTNREKVTAFGIDAENMFGFWDWVGGRYSLWSAIGLPIMLSLGGARFDELLAGAAEMDEHFRAAPAERNLPVLLGLIGIWYVNFQGYGSHLLAPYNNTLRRLPAWLQQLDMESNGKSVHRDGSATDHATGPIVWGEPGINGQHAYFQLLHQGSQIVPVDFILALAQRGQIDSHLPTLVANCLAQSAAMMRGKTADEVRAELTARGMAAADVETAIPHRVFPGNRPSNTLLIDNLSPHRLGALLALYEHKVFVQAAVWNINAFDQWGVELGKQLASDIENRLKGADGKPYDASTEALIALAAAGIGRH
ncbi:glucose-6-phosphate isomerase [Uliginosibacterium sp. H1]|uniref:glucose-6-phosphate isomerase n=1 Tax=Uliginosibacterium sp. H1 TaxID=3114757 RepID=UPI002E1865C4|nr:glucose-6-phosphate isomerase [Uliginosibacterium sp. H1]